MHSAALKTFVNPCVMYVFPFLFCILHSLVMKRPKSKSFLQINYSWHLWIIWTVEIWHRKFSSTKTSQPQILFEFIHISQVRLKSLFKYSWGDGIIHNHTKQRKASRIRSELVSHNRECYFSFYASKYDFYVLFILFCWYWFDEVAMHLCAFQCDTCMRNFFKDFFLNRKW